MKKFTINSTIDNTKLNCIDFHPSMKNPKCVIQIIHGMAEYINRYAPLAEYFNDLNIKVIGMDLRGHGKTGQNINQLGHISDYDGHTKIVEDTYDLNYWIQKRYPNSKKFILGHSFGSIILLNYLFKYHETIDGAIVCGSPGFASIKEKMSNKLSFFLAKHQGPQYINDKINKMAFSSANKKIKKNRTEWDWLNNNNNEVDKYIADPLCGFKCSNSFFYNLTTLIIKMSQAENIDLIPRDKKILFISGKEDPIGGYGNKNYKVVNYYKKNNFQNIELKLYNGMRHEILLENDREDVFQDIYNFINNV
ncbi:alpha/beta fold hydrolase [Mycoplasma phocoenae]|uniref:Alpha/beta hydrolase n=1 Tax=Mycoplasma phocoenae TaxID=754517 RepID=A0A858U804_9MOLU|nr:alpha/beta fold hydrolase [Mycoplasma phocoenae]QJG66866.1 alpha/beta hydrolase [Mycoplasma phocoenae]